MTKEQRTAMAHIISDATPSWQRCSANCTILPSLHGNVAKLMYDADIILIFAAKYYDYAR